MVKIIEINYGVRVRVMVFSGTFKNMSVLLVEEA